MKSKSKRTYFENQLKMYQGIVKKTWKVLQSLLPSCGQIKYKAKNPYLSSDTNLADKAENFNNIFCTIGKKLEKIYPHNKTYIFQLT